MYGKSASVYIRWISANILIIIIVQFLTFTSCIFVINVVILSKPLLIFTLLHMGTSVSAKIMRSPRKFRKNWSDRQSNNDSRKKRMR